ncbi:MAG: type I restriction-modification system subunit M N-terminal domain-containing protein [Bryobacteraceae bacterium]|nr:type I restriction-modification system subunit M N-terminal domain-containing protein [Bryobacteraceae bacterium]
MPRVAKRASSPSSSANLGFEAQLWAAANALRGSMDAAEYKHVVLGLIFLKYISDAFEAHHAKLEAQGTQGHYDIMQGGSEPWLSLITKRSCYPCSGSLQTVRSTACAT